MDKSLALLSVILVTTPGMGWAMSPETRSKLNSAIGGWKTLTPEYLLRGENADLLHELRVLAREKQDPAAIIPLMKLGDEEVIKRSLEALRKERANSRNSAMRQIGLSGNPKIIPLLANDLNRDESPRLIFFGDNGMLPLSMASASVIKAIILESSVFSAAVQEWAKRLPTVSVGLRDGVRLWWEVNKEAIGRGDYHSVVPVEGTAKPQPALPLPSPPPPGVSPVPSSPALAVMERSPSALPHEVPVWPWVAGLGALTAFGVLYWMKRHA